VEVDMRNVDLHVTPEIVLHVRQLRGRFIGVGKSGIPFLDDKKSYLVAIDGAEIAMDMPSLNALLNQHVLGHGRSNIEKVDVSVKDGLLKQKGVLDKGIDIPFNVKGAVEATPDGRIRIHSKSIKGLGLPMKPLMKVFGIEMDDLVKVEAGHGVVLEDNDMILDPSLMLPPPRIRGRVVNARIEGDQIVQTFGSTRRPRAFTPSPRSPNHIYWRGGDLRFGKLTMARTDLELIDMDPRDAFDFSVDRWNDQLVAGYSKTTTARGLKAYMPDYNDLKAPRVGRRGDTVVPVRQTR
jgi:hypothetical protein